MVSPLGHKHTCPSGPTRTHMCGQGRLAHGLVTFLGCPPSWNTSMSTGSPTFLLIISRFDPSLMSQLLMLWSFKSVQNIWPRAKAHCQAFTSMGPAVQVHYVYWKFNRELTFSFILDAYPAFGLAGYPGHPNQSGILPWKFTVRYTVGAACPGSGIVTVFKIHTKSVTVVTGTVGLFPRYF